MEFGCSRDPARLSRVLEAVRLIQGGGGGGGDGIQATCELAGGVDSEIGDRGSTLSGGQRQRVNLARVLYSHSQIAVLVGLEHGFLYGWGRIYV